MGQTFSITVTSLVWIMGHTSTLDKKCALFFVCHTFELRSM